MVTSEEKLKELEDRISFIEKQLKVSQSDNYTRLSNSELMLGLKNLIKKANLKPGLCSKSATEILLEDRR